MANARDLEWGWKNGSVVAPAIWGARCYVETWPSREAQRVKAGKRWTSKVVEVTKRQLAILPDRKSIVGDDQDSIRRLCEALDGGALDELRAAVSSGRLYGDEEAWVSVLCRVRFRVVCRGGYLYIAATLED